MEQLNTTDRIRLVEKIAKKYLKTEKKPPSGSNTDRKRLTSRNTEIKKNTTEKEKTPSRDQIDLDGPLIQDKLMLKKISKKIFEYFDFDQSGYIATSKIDMIDGLIKSTYGDACRGNDINMAKNYFMRLLDYDCDGKVSYSDFQTFFMRRFTKNYQSNLTEVVKPMNKLRESSVLGDITNEIIFDRRRSSGMIRRSLYEISCGFEDKENLDISLTGDLVESEIYMVQDDEEEVSMNRAKFDSYFDKEAELRDLEEFREMVLNREISCGKNFEELDFLQKRTEVNGGVMKKVKVYRNLFCDDSSNQPIIRELDPEGGPCFVNRRVINVMNTISEERESECETFKITESTSRYSPSSTESSSESSTETRSDDITENTTERVFKKPPKPNAAYQDVVKLLPGLTDRDTNDESKGVPMEKEQDNSNPFALKKSKEEELQCSDEDKEEDLDLDDCTQPDNSISNEREVISQYNSLNNQFLTSTSVDKMNRHDSIKETLKVLEIAEAKSNNNIRSTKSNRMIRELYQERSKSRKSSKKTSNGSLKNSNSIPNMGSRGRIEDQDKSPFNPIGFSKRESTHILSAKSHNELKKSGLGNNSNLFKESVPHFHTNNVPRNSSKGLRNSRNSIRRNSSAKISTLKNSSSKKFKEDDDIESKPTKKSLPSPSLVVTGKSLHFSTFEESSSDNSNLDTTSQDKSNSGANIEAALNKINKKHSRVRRLGKMGGGNVKSSDKIPNKETFENIKFDEESNQNLVFRASSSKPVISRRYKNSKKSSLNQSKKNLFLNENYNAPLDFTKKSDNEESVTTRTPKSQLLTANTKSNQENFKKEKYEMENFKKVSDVMGLKPAEDDQVCPKISVGNTNYATRRVNFYQESARQDRGSDVQLIFTLTKEKVPQNIDFTDPPTSKDNEEREPSFTPMTSASVSPYKIFRERNREGKFKITKVPSRVVSHKKSSRTEISDKTVDKNLGKNANISKFKIQKPSPSKDLLAVNGQNSLQSSLLTTSRHGSVVSMRSVRRQTFEPKDNKPDKSMRKNPSLLKIEKGSRQPAKNRDKTTTKRINIRGNSNRNIRKISRENSRKETKPQNLKINRPPPLIINSSRSIQASSINTSSRVVRRNVKQDRVSFSKTQISSISNYNAQPLNSSSFFTNREKLISLCKTQKKTIGRRKKMLKKSNPLMPNASIITNLTSSQVSLHRSSASVSSKSNLLGRMNMSKRGSKAMLKKVSSKEIMLQRDFSQKNSFRKSPRKAVSIKKKEQSKNIFVLAEGNKIKQRARERQERALSNRNGSRSGKKCTKMTNILKKRICSKLTIRDNKKSPKKIFDMDLVKSRQKSRGFREGSHSRTVPNLNEFKVKDNGRGRIPIAKKINRINSVVDNHK